MKKLLVLILLAFSQTHCSTDGASPNPTPTVQKAGQSWVVSKKLRTKLLGSTQVKDILSHLSKENLSLHSTAAVAQSLDGVLSLHCIDSTCQIQPLTSGEF